MRLNLFIRAYVPMDFERIQELIKCYNFNVASGLFHNIYLLSETDISTVYKQYTSVKNIIIKNSRKFNKIFQTINSITDDNDINVLANSDIRFDETIKLTAQMNKYEAYAITRYEENELGYHLKDGMSCSQDTWVFKGKIRPIDANFNLGFLGCDNKIAYEIAKAGYKLSNPCLSIKTYHVHKVEFRTHKEQDRLSHPYLFVGYSKLNNIPEVKSEKSYSNLKDVVITSAYNPRYNSEDVVIIEDNEFHSETNNDAKLIFKTRAPFKEQKRVIPFPIVSKTKDVQLIPISERKFDYCCIMNITGPVRQKIEGILNEYKNSRPNCVLDFACTRDNEKKHLETIRNSKICICPPTESSPETHRYADAAKLGCIIVCHKMPPFWYYNNKYEFQIPDWNLLPELLDRILSIPNEELETVSQTTRNYYDNYLSPPALNKHIKYFIERQKSIDERPVQKIISYALWGNNPKYVVGAKKNIELAKKWFPDWEVHIYLDEDTIFDYKSENLTIIPKKQTQSHDGLFWRFEPLDSDNIVIIRDLDDRLSERHKFVVDEWLQSDKDLHIVRDHPDHRQPIMGGIWGARNGLLKGIKNDIAKVEDKSFFGCDEQWLRKALWNQKYISNSYIHDAFRQTGLEHKIDRKRENYEFLGNVYDEHDNMVEFWKIIKVYEDMYEGNKDWYRELLKDKDIIS